MAFILLIAALMQALPSAGWARPVTVGFGYRASPPGALWATSWLEVTATRVADGKTRIVVLDENGLPVRLTDEAGTETKITRNGDGLPITIEEAANRPADKRVTNLYYSPGGDLPEDSSPQRHRERGEDTTERLESPGKLCVPSVSPCLCGGDSQGAPGYDSGGRPSWHSRPYKDGNGIEQVCVVSTEYDALHWPYRAIYPTSPQGVPGWTEETQFDEFGRPKQVTDATGTTGLAWDQFDRLVGVTPSGGRKPATLEYVLDGVNRRWITKTTLAGVGTWEEREDGKGRLSGIKDPAGKEYVVRYNLAGQWLTKSYGNGAGSTATYNWLGQLTYIGHYGPLVGAPRESFNYAYTATGRVAQETDQSGRPHAFFYDYLGQLTRETHPDLGTGNEYFYDKHGNRTKVIRNGVTSYYGTDTRDRLSWINTAKNGPPTRGQSKAHKLYAWDAFGQMAQRDGREKNGGFRGVLDFRWDADGRLREATVPGTPISSPKQFVGDYAADGERITATFRGNRIISSYGLQEERLFTPGLPVPQPPVTRVPGFAEKSNGVERHLQQDIRGSARTATDNTGAEAGRQRYDAYGLPQGSSGAGVGTRLGFAGEWGYETDRDLGLYYLYQRYYDPVAGRFISPDPIGWAGGLNLYGYVGNDPVNFVDPWGLEKAFMGSRR